MERLVRDAAERNLLTTARSLQISKKRLLGWEPTETQEYVYDDSGRVASVTVRREPEWDDVSREEMLALTEYEAGICSCGFHESLTRDKSNVFSFELDHCPVCAGGERYGRLQEKEDAEEVDKLGESPAPTAPRPSDGRRVLMRMKPAASAALTP